MAENVKLTLSSRYGGKNPGDEVSVDAATAKRLVNGGIAKPSTVAAAKKAGVDTDTSVTKS